MAKHLTSYPRCEGTMAGKLCSLHILGPSHTCTSSRSVLAVATKALASSGMPKVLPSLPGRSRRANTHVPDATSRGPTSHRTGTPCKLPDTQGCQVKKMCLKRPTRK